MQHERQITTKGGGYSPIPLGEYTELRTHVLGRLRHACEHLPPAEFNEVVDKICSFKMRWNVR